MKILIIGTNMFPIPLTGYGGLEQLVFNLAEGLAARGHTISVVCPQGSKFTGNIESILTPVREEEEQSWNRYKGRLEAREWEVVLDSSWQHWSMMSSAGKDPQLPIVNWHHTSSSVYQSLAPVQHNMWVGLSKSHAEELVRHFKTEVRYCYNGIDTEFYKPLPIVRGTRYLSIARYTPEKGFLELIHMAKRLRIGIDLYGDTEIVSGQDYVKTCFNEADGYLAKANPGISREETVRQYSSHKAMLQWRNWMEPFGLDTCESQACECPIIARRSGAIPELVKEGQTGFIVDTIAEMEELIKTDAVDKLDRKVARQHIVDNFGLDKFVSSWEKLLSEVKDGARW